jgi:hypothetical protein
MNTHYLVGQLKSIQLVFGHFAINKHIVQLAYVIGRLVYFFVAVVGHPFGILINWLQLEIRRVI